MFFCKYSHEFTISAREELLQQRCQWRLLLPLRGTVSFSFMVCYFFWCHKPPLISLKFTRDTFLYFLITSHCIAHRLSNSLTFR